MSRLHEHIKNKFLKKIEDSNNYSWKEIIKFDAYEYYCKIWKIEDYSNPG